MNLEEHGVSTESVYELLFRLIILDTSFFSSKKDLVEENFETI